MRHTRCNSVGLVLICTLLGFAEPGSQTSVYGIDSHYNPKNHQGIKFA